MLYVDNIAMLDICVNVSNEDTSDFLALLKFKIILILIPLPEITKLTSKI